MELKMKEVVIVSAARTAVGSFGGSLSKLSAAEIGAVAAKEAIKMVFGMRSMIIIWELLQKT